MTSDRSRVFTCPQCKRPFIRLRNTYICCSKECHLERKKLVRRRSTTAIAQRRREVKLARESDPLWIIKEAERKRAKERLRRAEKYGPVYAEMNRIKLESGCVDCGYREHPTALQFDHVRGKKIADVSSFVVLKDALTEISKCEVRCANCHSIKTWKWKQKLKKERIASALTLLAQSGT